MLIELQKIIKNKFFFTSLITLLIISLCATWFSFKEFQQDYQLINSIYKNNIVAQSLTSPNLYWIGQSNHFFSSLYYFIFPLLISMPIVDSLFREKRSGFINYHLVRQSRSNYYTNKIFISFASAFSLFIIPLLLSILFMNILTGVWDYSSYSNAYSQLIAGKLQLPDNTFLSLEKTIFSGLMSISPYLYILIYYIIGGLYAGIYICFGIVASSFIKNRYLILFTPMCLYLITWIFFTIVGHLAWDPFNFIDPRQTVTRLSYLPFIIDFAIILAIIYMLFTLGEKKNRDILP